jgi:O-antigen/teichoic acid export membrane protein
VILRALNLVLRGATLLSRFLLIFVLAKFLEPAEVGLYGLFVGTVTYFVMAVGFDFYTHASRDLIMSDQSQWCGLLRDQGAFYGLAYIAVLPFGLAIFFLEYLPWSLGIWFVVLLMLEHLAFEFNRVLLAMSQPIWASIVLFLRSGLWAIVLAICLWQVPAARSLDFVFAAWAAGAASACLLAASRLGRLDRRSLARNVDWSWIWRGTKVAFPFLLATLSLRALYTFDRYWIDSIGGLEVVSAYVLFIGVANAIAGFLDAAVYSFAYPKLVALAGNGKMVDFRSQLKLMTAQALSGVIVLGGLALVIIYPLVQWLDRPIYLEMFDLAYWCVLVGVLASLSMIPHFALYACRRDRAIVLIHLLSLPVFLLAGFFLIPLMEAAAVPAALAASFLFILIGKAVAYSQWSASNVRRA